MAYELPKGNVLLSVSGGRTSGYMLHKVLEANGGLPDRCKVLFANTGREMPETLDFVQRISDTWSVPITWLEYTRRDNKVGFNVVNHNSASRSGEPFDTLIYKPYLPNVAKRFCTEELKVRTMKRYLVSCGWKRWINTIGIRADERHRVKESRDNRWINWYPLYEGGDTNEDVMSFWKRHSFDLEIMKGAGNCDGCFLKSEATLAAMFREHPDRMAWWTAMEKKIGTTFHKSRSYSDIGSFVERQGSFIFDDESFLCQADDGECTG